MLGFIVYKKYIQVDPLKVEVILNLSPPSTLCQLQSLQGKENFLRHFIPNYAELTKGFTWLLKHYVPLIWDELTDKSVNALKHVFTYAPLFHPPDYHRDYFLYLVVSDSTIGMVLFQEDEYNNKHVIYYLIRNLTPIEIKYTHVDKLALVVVKVVQRFCHYILLCKTTMISDCNPMMYILTKKLLGGK